MSYADFLLACLYKIGRKCGDLFNVWDLRHLCVATWNEKSGISQRRNQETLYYFFPCINSSCYISLLCTELPDKAKENEDFCLGNWASSVFYASRWGDAITWFRIRWASVHLESIYSHSCINVCIHHYINWKLSKATLICWILMLIITTPALLMCKETEVLYLYL